MEPTDEGNLNESNLNESNLNESNFNEGDLDESSLYEGSLSAPLLKKWKTTFEKNAQFTLATNACTKVDPELVYTSRLCIESFQHVFEYNVENTGKPITNQKSCGSCWIYACLNAARAPFIKAMGLDSFEFSQPYLFFWHKVEACNFWLNSIVKTAKAKEALDGRLMYHLLDRAVGDGGQWDMAADLINKYGMMPKECFPSDFSHESSGKMNAIIKSLLRLYAKQLRDLVDKKATDAEINAKLEKQMYEIYKVIAVCYSVPPEKFTWTYYSNGKTKKIEPITPLEFYTKYVKPVFDVNQKVCLVHDPRPGHAFKTAYTVEYLGNMVGGRQIIYNNQTMDVLLRAAGEAIKNNEAVWFGSDTSKMLYKREGIGDLKVFDFKTTFGLSEAFLPKKGDRMDYGDSAMGHAMALTGVSYEGKPEPTKFKVENSWGENSGHKGYMLITAGWFKEYVFEIVVDKKFVSHSVLDVFKQKPKVLPFWDPMGTVAH